MSFKEIAPENFNESVFKVIGKDWLLLSGTVDGKTNAMTASWGGMGIMWGKPVAFVFIRPQRYTKEFVDKGDGMAISVFDESYRKMLGYFGSVSGRDEDKIAKAGLTKVESDGQVYFAEARAAMVCRKLYAQEMRPECFFDKESETKWYPGKDYHTMYVMEIEKLLIK